MRRRSILSALVAGLAGLGGCSTLQSDRAARQRTYGVPPTTVAGTDADPPGRAVRSVGSRLDPARRMVVGVDPATPVPEGVQFSLAFAGAADRGSPAVLWVELANAGDRARPLGFEGTPPLGDSRGRRAGSTDAVGALLVPADSPGGRTLASGTPTGGCWRATRPVDHPRDRVERSLLPGTSIARRYLFVRADDAACPFPRRAVYRFGDVQSPVSFTVSVWDPSLRAPGESRFSRSVPSLPSADRTVWFHEATARTPVYLRPVVERIGSGDTARFVLENFSTRTLRIDPGAWGLYRLEGDDWEPVAAGDTGSRSRPVPPGGRHSVSLSVTDRDGHPPTAADSASASVSGVGPGTYAVRHGTTRASLSASGPVRIGEGVEADAGGRTTTHAALVRIER